MDESKLVKKLNQHSRSALDQAIGRYTPYVSAVILRTMTGHACREDVEELCADVFVALWDHTGTLDPAQGVRPWLAAVDALDEPDRTLFIRYYYEEDKLKTIAAELGLTQTAAKQRLFRGRKALKTVLQEGMETP